MTRKELANIRRRTRTAVERGRLVRPNICTRCSGPGPIDAHHKDYSKPFDVEWLCRVCHIAVHRQRLDTDEEMTAILTPAQCRIYRRFAWRSIRTAPI